MTAAERRAERCDNRLAAAAVAAVLCAPGLMVYVTNRAEFPFAPAELAAVLVPIAAAIALAVAAALRLTSRFSERAAAGARCAVLAAAAYLYGNWAFFRHLLPVESGGAGMTVPRILFDLFAAALFAAGWWFLFRRIGRGGMRRLALLLILCAAVPAGIAAFSRGSLRFGRSDYLISERTKFEFGRRRNVILIVMDAMGERLFKRTLERFPEVRGEFRDFTAFDRMESHPFAETVYAVPEILSGKVYAGEREDGVGMREFRAQTVRSEDSLFANFRRAGFRCEAYPYALDAVESDPAAIDNLAPRDGGFRGGETFFGVWIASLMPNSLREFCGGVRFSLAERFVPPPTLFEGEGLPVEAAEAEHDLICARTLAAQGVRVGETDDCFKYLHFKGGHHPYVTDEHLRRTMETDEVRQLRGSLGMVFSIMAELRRLGLYRDALIVVTGDHSERHTPETISLVKLPGATGETLRFHSTPCRLRDLNGTILAGAGLRPASASLFARPAPPPAAAARGEGALRECRLGGWRQERAVTVLSKLTDRIPVWDLRFDGGTLLLIRSEGLRRECARLEYRMIDWNRQETEYLSAPLAIASPSAFEAVRFDFRGLPAGVYRMLERRRFHGGEEREVLLPGFLRLDAAGHAVFERHAPEPRPAPPAFGVPVVPAGPVRYPALEATGGCDLESMYFLLPVDGGLQLRLPSAPSAQRLRIECAVTLDREAEAFFRDGPRRLGSVTFSADRREWRAVEFAVPAEAVRRGVLALAVEWRSADGRGTGAPVLKIRSLTLLAGENPSGKPSK